MEGAGSSQSCKGPRWEVLPARWARWSVQGLLRCGVCKQSRADRGMAAAPGNCVQNKQGPDLPGRPEFVTWDWLGLVGGCQNCLSEGTQTRLSFREGKGRVCRKHKKRRRQTPPKRQRWLALQWGGRTEEPRSPARRSAVSSLRRSQGALTTPRWSACCRSCARCTSVQLAAQWVCSHQHHRTRVSHACDVTVTSLRDRRFSAPL